MRTEVPAALNGRQVESEKRKLFDSSFLLTLNKLLKNHKYLHLSFPENKYYNIKMFWDCLQPLNILLYTNALNIQLRTWYLCTICSCLAWPHTKKHISQGQSKIPFNTWKVKILVFGLRRQKQLDSATCMNRHWMTNYIETITPKLPRMVRDIQGE